MLNTKCNKKKRSLLGMGILLSCLCMGCATGEHAGEKELMLHLPFDQQGGIETEDASGKLPAAEVNYLYTHAVYKENEEPQWRAVGVDDADMSLLFDGCSTSVEYSAKEICVEGNAFSISVWVAPRMFEWDDPKAADAGTEQLTGIVSQYNKSKKQGFILGYQRFGRLCFQVGTGDSWISLWSDTNLSKYEWNQVTATFDGENGTICLYLNGELAAEKNVQKGSAIEAADKERLVVGNNSHGERIAAGSYQMFSGLMDELKLYQKVLSPEEIAYVEQDPIPFEDIWMENLLTDDSFKTQYHGGPYQFWMNEPHAPVYYNGMYHLFYQNNMAGTYWRNICWGHLVSTDMVNWKPIKEAITPIENSVVPDGVWSGGAAMDANGVPLLFFTAGNDSFEKDGLISNQNIGVAYPADISDPELTDWVVAEKLAIQQKPGEGRTGEFRDPYIWKEGDIWCMLICSGSTETTGGSALLYETDRLELLDDGTIDMDWKYMGPVYEMENQTMTYGTSWELPILTPIYSEDGTKSKYIFMISPAPASSADNKVYYFIGDFDVVTGKFTPDEAFDNQPGLLDYGSNIFTGPSVLVDPVTGETCIFSIMQDQRNGAEEGAAGWAHCVGLTRKIWLNEEGTDVKLAPLERIESLQGEPLIQDDSLNLADANEKLAAVQEDLVYIRAIIDPMHATEFGIRVKAGENGDQTTYTYNMEEETISGYTSSTGSAAAVNKVKGALTLPDGKLKMELYIDRSLVEAFFNDTKAVTIRSYSDYDSRGISFFGDGEIMVEELYVAPMKSIYE